MFSVLIVEDDANLQRMISAALRTNGYRTFCACNGAQAMELLDHEHADLIITDLMMPKLDGFELTDALRTAGFETPVLIITAKEEFADKERGFSLGADDYMVKPIDIGELVLRVGALMRRAQIAHEHRITIGNITLDYNSLSVKTSSGTETLPKKEFYLLFMLLSYPEVIFTRRQLLDELWGMENDVDERTVDVHIRRLRERYGDVDEFEIVTVRGLGYKAVRKV